MVWSNPVIPVFCKKLFIMNVLTRTLLVLGLLPLVNCTDKPETTTAAIPVNEAYELRRIALEPGYSELDTFSVADGLARAEKEGLYGYIDSSGKEIVPLKNYNVQAFYDGLGLVEETQGVFYFVDKTGKKVIDLAGYENAFSFVDGYATVAKADGYGLIDKTGKEVIPCTAGSAIWPVSPGNFILDGKDGKLVVNAQGQPTLPFTGFGDLYYDKDNNQYAFNKGDGWVIAAPDGTVKQKVDCDGLIFNSGAYFLSKTTDTAGTVNAVMNGKGEFIVPYGKYYSINSTVADGLICVGNKTGETPTEESGISIVNQKVGYIDLTGKEVVPLQYEDIMADFSEGLAAVQLNGKQGYIDRTGKLVIPATYDRCGSFSNGYAKVVTADIPSYIDKTGKEVQ